MYTALSDYGWKREDGKLAVEWEVPENIERAKASMEFMLKGCNAKADAQLIIYRCSCKRSGRICGSSCQCLNCTNIPSQTQTCTTELEIETLDLLEQQDEEDEQYITDSEDDELEDLRVERETDEIMRFVFGDDYSSDESDNST